MNSVSEECCAVLQMFHAEMALSDVMRKPRITKASIETILSTLIKPPEIIFQGSEHLKCNVYVQELKSDEQEIVRMHYGVLSSSIVSIVKEIADLLAEEFAGKCSNSVLNKTWLGRL